MSTGEHPDVVPYAQGDPVETKDLIEKHLAECAECRDLVLFIRKTNAALRYEGRLSRVAKALGITVEHLKHEIRLGTSITVLMERPPQAPVRPSPEPVRPLSPTKK